MGNKPYIVLLLLWAVVAYLAAARSGNPSLDRWYGAAFAVVFLLSIGYLYLRRIQGRTKEKE